MAEGTKVLRKTLFRKKQYDPAEVEDTRLKRCISRWDLTALGVGSSLGVGVFVLIGPVALSMAGPSVVLSILLAAVAALFAGLCYAEFASRIPRAGAAYNYTYLAIGEVVAFLIGWSNILEGLFGTASLARGLSMHVDAMSNASMSEWFQYISPISVAFMSPYFDYFAFLIVIVVGALLSFGSREAAVVNKLFFVVSLGVVVFIVIAGAVAADASNWSIPRETVPAGHGRGGFFPFGVWGTVSGAAVCFYAFVGFDAVCSAGEEIKDPRRVIPITIVSIIISLLVVHVTVAIVVTMMVPYYMQESFNAVAAAFSFVGWEWAKWVVSIGALFGLYSSLFGALFPLPRLLYSMASDGLIINWFSKLTARKSPALATAFVTVIISLLAGLFELQPLILMMCFGTLFSYTMVAVSVIIMRYRCNYTPGDPRYLRQIFGLGRSPTRASARIIYACLALFVSICVLIGILGQFVRNLMIPYIILHCLIVILILIMTVQPKVKEEAPFQTPIVPLLPCLSIYVNINMMAFLDGQTWIRVGIWIVVGIIVYLIGLCFIKREKNNLKDNMALARIKENGKSPVQIVVESPTPPDTLYATSNYGGDIQTEEELQQEIQEGIVRNYVPQAITLHQAYIENNEEKEAKIIDLLDQVLQAEEATYGEMIMLKEVKEENEEETEPQVEENHLHRKSLSELSDAGSDASLGIQVLSKYDVIAQVHREDLPKVNEEEERSDKDDSNENYEIDDQEQEQVTAFTDSETNSRTDESGYSDTIDRNGLSESLEESKEEIPNIPEPPPFDENFFISPNFKKSYTIASKHTKLPSSEPEETEENKPQVNIPEPPPFDENFFISPNFKKSYTIASKHSKPPPPEPEETEENKPRESINSNNSLGDGNLAFGSDRQLVFMSKLSNIFQSKISNLNSDEEEPTKRRSYSSGNVIENTDFAVTNERPPLFLALKNEIISKEAAQNLRPINVEDKPEAQNKDVKNGKNEESEEEEDSSLNRQELKSKLENIFATSGAQLVKPRLMKSNPPTPEESYQTDNSSTESIPKLPKMEKNDTLKRQRDKFSEVLNSFRLSFNKEDVV